MTDDELERELPADYGELLAQVKQEVRSARVRAARAINSELIKMYWRIGTSWSSVPLQSPRQRLSGPLPHPSAHNTAHCYTTADLNRSDNHIDFGVAVSGDDAQQVGDAAAQAREICSSEWAKGRFSTETPTFPNYVDGPATHPVPPLSACVLANGEVAIFPGPPNVCGSVGLANAAGLGRTPHSDCATHAARLREASSPPSGWARDNQEDMCCSNGYSSSQQQYSRRSQPRQVASPKRAR